jgi:hypothetical protein
MNADAVLVEIQETDRRRTWPYISFSNQTHALYCIHRSSLVFHWASWWLEKSAFSLPAISSKAIALPYGHGF